MKLDLLKTRMQEVGYCRVAGLTVAQIVEIVTDLGIDPGVAFVDAHGWLAAGPDSDRPRNHA